MSEGQTRQVNDDGVEKQLLLEPVVVEDMKATITSWWSDYTGMRSDLDVIIAALDHLSDRMNRLLEAMQDGVAVP